MADTQHRTGQQIIGEINKDILRELYVQSEIVEDYKILRSMLTNPDIKPKDFVPLLKLLWEYTIEKPKQTSEVRFPDGISKMTDEQLDDIIKGFNDRRQASKTGNNQETTSN